MEWWLSTCRLSLCPSEASGFDGDADANAVGEEAVLMPDSTACDWLGYYTHGDGEDEELPVHIGNLGCLAGNWGGIYKSETTKNTLSMT